MMIPHVLFGKPEAAAKVQINFKTAACVALALLFIICCSAAEAHAGPLASLAEDVRHFYDERECETEIGCDGVCGSGAEDFGCGCGVPESMCNDMCPLYEVRLWEASVASDGTELMQGGGSHRVIDKSGFAQSSCFQGIYQQVLNVCRELGYGALGHWGDRFLNDCYGAAMGYDGTGMDFLTKAQSRIADCLSDDDEDWDECGREVIRKMRKAGENTIVYFRADCTKEVDPTESEEDEACDGLDFFWRGTPISLLWEPQTDIEKDKTVVNFPLDPGYPQRWYVWKASGQAPLLVYDPSNSQHITSASQLFGRWTFGGKRLASADSSVGLAQQGAVQWEDGYEALASLDQNGDKSINGAELQPLALWFDGNRDGISQPGEVRRLEAEGVTKLYYHPDRRDLQSGSVSASLGYERLAGGETIRGASIDWTGEAVAGPEELVLRNQLRNESCATADAAGAPSFFDRPAAPARANSKVPDLAGFWNWSRNTAEKSTVKEKMGGTLLLTPLPDGRLEGYSIAEFSLGAGKTRSVGAVMPLQKGSWKTDSQGDVTLRFYVVGKQGTLLLSEVKYSGQDQNSLAGRSRYKSADIRGSTLVEYSWSAKRMETRREN